MNNNINNENKVKLMKATIILGFIITTCFMSSYAIQDNILRYDFEFGSDTTILDSSGYDNHGSGQGTQRRDNDEKFGGWAMEFDGFDDYIISLTTEPIPSNMSVSVWVNIDDSAEMTIWEIFNADNQIELVIDTNAGDNLFYEYIDNNGISNQEVVTTNNFPEDTWIFITSVFDFSNNNVKTYIDGVLTSEFTSTTPINKGGDNNILTIGANNIIERDFDGQIDEFRIFSFLLNDTNIQDLYINNDFTKPTIEEEETPDEEDNITGLPTQDNNLIISYSPQDNDNLTFNDYISVTLNSKAYCELYINNIVVANYTDVLTFQYNNFVGLSYGLNDYFIYCEQIVNNTKLFSITNTTTFNLLMGNPEELIFNFQGTDFNINDKSLFAVTPCLDISIQAGDLTKNVLNSLNTEPRYFVKLQNGQAIFNVTPDEYEVCLINGNIQYSDFGYTQNYNINKVEGQVKLGNYAVISNVTNSYGVTLEEFDIYDKLNPKAYGETWSSLSGSLILFMLGSLVIFAGVKSEGESSGKIVIAGVLLILGAFGLGLNGFLGILI